MHSPNASGVIGATADDSGAEDADVDADRVDESVDSAEEQAAAEPITAKAASPQKVVRRIVCFMAMTV
ncbi:hypothetical protein VST63_00290 [Mycolicibacterium sp. 050232]|uniref:hypothetical protein n=1 Tax=Mycolicibacterium sp. 050232 TaxID=3113982 RepID=UPI002E2DEF49|nr:hypothetical protein [Mycolicibacterium sp. 050232]MED5810781.1 hypothetical protein [Mycolicibacterium sp. 050232]